MDKQQWKDKLYLVATEMLKYGEPCQVSDQMRLTFEDGRELVLELMDNGTIACRGVLVDDFDGLEMTPTRFVGSASQSPFEIARTVSLAVLDKYTTQWESIRTRTERKRMMAQLQRERAKALALGLRVQGQLLAEENGITVVFNKGVIKLTENGFRVEATFDVPVEDLIVGINAMMGLTSWSSPKGD